MADSVSKGRFFTGASNLNIGAQKLEEIKTLWVYKLRNVVHNLYEFCSEKRCTVLMNLMVVNPYIQIDLNVL